MVRRLMLCLDSRALSFRKRFLWALQTFVRSEDEVHLVLVLPHRAYFATASHSLRRNRASQTDSNKKHDESAVDVLKNCVDDVKSLNIPLKGLHTYAIASDLFCTRASSSLLEYAESRNIDLVVLARERCSRQTWWLSTMTGTRCIFADLSDRCIQRMDCPVIVFPPDMMRYSDDVQSEKSAEEGKERAKNICMVAAELESSKEMVQWVADRLITPGDMVTVITVCASVTHCDVSGRSIEKTAVGDYALSVAEEAAIDLENVLYQKKMSRVIVQHKSIESGEHSAIGVGQAICNFAEINKSDLLVIDGNFTGLVWCKRVFGNWCDAGSAASNYCTHFSACPVLTYKC